MNDKIQRVGGPSIGVALGYFVTIFAVKEGWILEANQAQAVAMAGIIGVHIVNEFKQLISWIGSCFTKRDE